MQRRSTRRRSAGNVEREMMSEAKIIVGDARVRLAELESGSIQTCVTSPPYWVKRDYGHPDQMGLEDSPEDFVKALVDLFRDVRRVLADDGTLWLNIGDTYCGSGRGWNVKPSKQSTNRGSVTSSVRAARTAGPGLKNKDLIGVPWMLAFALRSDGWYLRSEIVWAKPNPMTESVQDRPTCAHEKLFLLTKKSRYFYDAKAIDEEALTGWNGSQFDTGKTADHQMQRMSKQPRFGGAKYGDAGEGTMSGNEYEPNGRRNRRNVWTIAPQPFSGAHFAVMPEALVEPCVLAGSRGGDSVLDPFAGSGTVGVVALRNQRDFVGIELNKEYAQMAAQRIFEAAPLLNGVTVL